MHAAPAQNTATDALPAELLRAIHYLPKREVATITEAYRLGTEAHAGQLRLSGEHYISHPVEVAKICAELGLDAATIVSGILHDVLEDTTVTKREITQRFGEEVAEIVDGVSKITHLRTESRAISQAENFQKMLLAMTKDLRVILVKLADRLHNMRTLGYQKVQNRRRIAKETLEIYAPIAERLGMDKVRRELEELGFAALYPVRSRVLSERMDKDINQRSQLLEKVCETITQRLVVEDIEHEISKRRKNMYSVYRKMRRKHLHFSEVLDLFAIRIILSSVDDCYRTLGLIHNLYNPRPGYFKDYIALPKANGYQSLHTVLFGPQGIPVEIQMRTKEMNEVSEQGIAAHALYKTSGEDYGKIDHIKAKEWVNELIDISNQASDSMDFLENVKGEGLVTDSVYVFTPEGNIIALPRGASALDFAFAVHTELGLHCSAAIVNKQPVPLNSRLQSGQTVEIFVAKDNCTNPAWLDFVITAKARAAIRNQLKQLHKTAALDLGKLLLHEALEALDTSLDNIKPKQITALAKTLGLRRAADVFAEIGLGNQMPALIARRLLGEKNRLWRKSGKKSAALTIKGTEGLAVTYAKCCHPIPGDGIVGIMTPGKGLVVHRRKCHNLSRSDKRKKTQVLLEWSSARAQDTEYQVAIRVKVQHKRGMLAVIAGQIAQTKTNIENISIDSQTGAMAMLTLVISVRDNDHLEAVMNKVRIASSDIEVERAN